MERKPITQNGYQKLQTELQNLIKFERPKIINDIATARALGDLKENAEYHAAKERQAFIEGRIERINFLLANSDVIDTATVKSDSIKFGATVTYEDLDTEEKYTWKIVGEDETNIEQKEISFKSPIAKALMGKSVEDEVNIVVPRGTIEVRIVSIVYK